MRFLSDVIPRLVLFPHPVLFSLSPEEMSDAPFGFLFLPSFSRISCDLFIVISFVETVLNCHYGLRQRHAPFHHSSPSEISWPFGSSSSDCRGIPSIKAGLHQGKKFFFFYPCSVLRARFPFI